MLFQICIYNHQNAIHPCHLSTRDVWIWLRVNPCILDSPTDISRTSRAYTLRRDISQYNILIISAEGTVRILRYTSLSYLYPTCTLSCHVDAALVERAEYWETVIYAFMKRGFLDLTALLCLLNKTFISESQKATKSLLFFCHSLSERPHKSSLAHWFMLWTLYVFSALKDAGRTFRQHSQSDFHVLFKPRTQPRPTTAILVKSCEWY